MVHKKNKFNFLNKTALIVISILIMLLSSVLLFWQGNKNSMQATPAMLAQVYFKGEYRIGDGEWQEIVEGEHIPSTKVLCQIQGEIIRKKNCYSKCLYPPPRLFLITSRH